MANQELLQPQEIEVFYIIPTIKKHLAAEMKKNGLKQKEIAKILSIKDATVSQYLNDKRGNKVSFDENIIEEIRKSSAKVKDTISYLREMQHLLRKVKETRAICRIHKELSKIPSSCCPELIDCFGGEKDATRNAGVCY